MGAIFLAVWSFNLSKGYYSPSGWAHFVQHYADTTKVRPYAHLLNSVMIPNATIFAYGQFAIEFVVFGLFLVLGVFTPASGLLAARFQLNLLVATSGTTDWPGTYIIMAVLLLAVSLSQAGRTLGVDARLARRDPHPRLPVYSRAARRAGPEPEQAQPQQTPEDVAHRERRAAPRPGDLGRAGARPVTRVAGDDARAGEPRLHRHLGGERVGALLQTQPLERSRRTARKGPSSLRRSPKKSQRLNASQSLPSRWWSGMRPVAAPCTAWRRDPTRGRRRRRAPARQGSGPGPGRRCRRPP